MPPRGSAVWATARLVLPVPPSPTNQKVFFAMNDPELKKELAGLKTYCEKLRADLSATNAALIAVFAAIPELYRDRVLEQLARRSVQRDEYAAQPIDPVAEQVLPLMAASEDRIYRELQKVAAQRRAEGV